MDEKMTRKAAKELKISYEDLADKIEKMRILREKHDLRINRMRQRLESQYHRVSVYERMAVPPDVLETHRSRLAIMQTKFRSARRCASNQLVAEVLGIPQGTVDSGLARLKKKKLYPT
jgi:hypothetical protein